MTTEAMYGRLPVVLQNAACWCYGVRESTLRRGKMFRETAEELQESERWRISQIEAYQDAKLTELISHAYESVPYYRNLMKSLRLTPRDIRGRRDLYKLPVLTKEDVRTHFEGLRSEKAATGDLIVRHTSGTTGKSLHFFVERSAIAFQWAVWWRHRTRFGLSPDDWHVNFTGKLAVPPTQNRPPYWRWNRPMRQVIINMQHITPAKITDIAAFLSEQNFKFYSGYPSIIHALVVASRDRELSILNPPRVIVTGAENVLDYQRRDIQDYFGAVLTDQYGFSEACGNASQCPEFLYHEDFEFGILECVDPVPMQDGSVKGKIICTGFASPGFPFIRYEVGDVGVWQTPSKRCPCGRESSALLRVEGRRDDYVITPEGLRIMRFDYVFKATTNVKECQIVQDRLGEIRVRLVRRPAYSDSDERLILEEIRRWISPELRVMFEYVSEIERDGSGKFRAVRSSINNCMPQ
jgi:phenylacetate-CoA ligase